MQKNRIIANNIAEEDLLKGHLSIRFLPDGFSFLLSSQMHDPILLYSFTGTGSAYTAICRDELNAYDLINRFSGECTITTGSVSATLIPESLFGPQHAASFLDFTNRTPTNETIMAKKVYRRPWYIVFALPPAIEKLAGEFLNRPRVFHSITGMLSLADQVSASDHQRGFIMAEIQQNILEILIIKDDDIILSNRYIITSNDDAFYHILNTYKQTGLNRETIPLYLAGDIRNSDAFFPLVRKYIRKVADLPYTIKDVDRETVQQFMLLTEAVKCV